MVLARPTAIGDEHAAVLALLADGESWSSSALAIALGASQRTVQRALDETETCRGQNGEDRDAGNITNESAPKPAEYRVLD